MPGGFRLSEAEDLYWLLRHQLLNWLRDLGLPVLAREVPHLNKKKIALTTGLPFVHQAGYRPSDHTIDAAFCLRYGLNDYSQEALNYLLRGQGPLEGESFVRIAQRAIFGSFGFVIDCPPLPNAPQLPPLFAVCGSVVASYGRAQCIVGWLGVRFAGAVEWPRDEYVEEPPMDFGDPTRQMLAGGYTLDFTADDWPWPKPQAAPTRIDRIPGEEQLYAAAVAIFGAGQVVRRYRGREMQRLELDVWVPSHGLAFEFQGAQHFKRVAHWHGEHGFEMQRERDRLKAELCKELGYRLVYFDDKHLHAGGITHRSLLLHLRRAFLIEPHAAKHFRR